ncbi:hypothetical protein ACFXHA_43195 [Nocardia sp. NPDC059240]|uniref:hypothetical protein n=1 Tax=Nocardia sp. NPDC059240 TaxID=3346786 RepID=UPI0036A50CBF
MSLVLSLPVLVPAVPALAAGVVVAIRRSGVLDTVERILRYRNKTRVDVVREQARMAALPLEPGTELSHTIADGSSLTIRRVEPHEDGGRTRA